MFDTIVLGHDGSDDADHALSVAVDLARTYDAVLVIVHIDERVVGKASAASIRVDEGEIQEGLRRRAKELNDQGVTTKVEFAASILGGPAKVIEQIADRDKAELIVVGTRGRSAVAELLLGGVTLRLLHVAHRPVMAVPREPAS